MRIVHVTPFYYPVIGGVEKVVRRVAEYMASKGYDVHVVTYNRLRSDGVGSLPREELINNVHVIRLKPDFIWSHGTYSRELPEIIRMLKPDIVHVHVWRHPHVFQIAKLREKLGFKTILHGHGPFHKLIQLGLITWFYHRIFDIVGKHILDMYDKIIALTPYEKMIYTALFKQPSNKIEIIPNGLDDEIFYYSKELVTSNNGYNLLFVGRVSREKNLELAIKALKYLSKNYDQLVFIIVGPDENFIQRLYVLAKKLKVSRYIRYMGPIYGISKYKIYAASTIFVNPSLYESFSISLLEAQAFGKPCVVTGWGGQLYVAPPGISSIYAKSNPRSYANAISTLLGDKKLYQRLSSNALKWARRHAWSHIFKRYESIYNLW